MAELSLSFLHILKARLVALVRDTPFHPQWLIRNRKSTSAMLEQYAFGLVLDVGCADRWAQRELSRTCRYVGLDTRHTGFELYGARPDLLADVSRLPICDSSVQTVLLFEVLEHLRCPRRALQECFRVLTPGGVILLSTPFLYPVHDAPHDFQRFTRYGLERELSEVGLAMESVESVSSALATAALLASLAAGGIIVTCWKTRSPWLIASPLLMLWILALNLLGWIGGKLLPDWRAMTVGHLVVARKP